VGKRSQGVVAVGGLSLATERSTLADPAPSADGSALRSAIGAWLIGADAAICSVIAGDLPRQSLLRLSQSIDLTRVRTVPGDTPGENLHPTADQLASLSPDWSVHVCGMPIRYQRDLVRAVTGRVAAVTLGTLHRGLEAELEVPALLELASQCDVLLPGRSEVASLWPGEPPREVLRIMAKAGVRAAVITLGVGGSIGIRDGRISWMPAYPVDARGGLGGGDVYAGAFAAVYAGDRDLTRSMAWASAAASVVLEVQSPTDAISEFSRSTVDYRARALQTEAAGSDR
jgi:pfkB family carbohydrate kinase